MTKDEKLFHVECILPERHLHGVLTAMEDGKGREIRARPLRNGAFTEEPAPAQRKAKDKSNGKGLSTIERSREQQEWLAKHVKGEMTAVEIRDKMKAAGVPMGGTAVYGALGRAVQSKLLKRVKPGLYRPA